MESWCDPLLIMREGARDDKIRCLNDSLQDWMNHAQNLERLLEEKNHLLEEKNQLLDGWIDFAEDAVHNAISWRLVFRRLRAHYSPNVPFDAYSTEFDEALEETKKTRPDWARPNRYK